MKKTESSNRSDDSRKINHSVNHDRMRVTANLQGRNSGDGREGSYKNEKVEKSGVKMAGEEDNFTKKKDTGKNEKNMESELKIRSEKQPEKGVEKDEGGMTGEKRRDDPKSKLEESKSDIVKDKGQMTGEKRKNDPEGEFEETKNDKGKDKGEMTGEKQEHDPEGEFEEEKKDLTKDKDTSDGSWKQPYKGKKEEVTH